MTRRRSPKPNAGTSEHPEEGGFDGPASEGVLTGTPRQRLCKRLGIEFVEEGGDLVAHLLMMEKIALELEQTQPEFRPEKKRGRKSGKVQEVDQFVVQLCEALQAKYFGEKKNKILRKAVKIAEDQGFLAKGGDPDANFKRVRRAHETTSEQRRAKLAADIAAKASNPDKNSAGN